MNEPTTPRSKYVKFMAMIGTGMILMYLLTYLNSSQIMEHAWFSETRLFMTLIMGAVMALVMLGFMRDKYRNRLMNAAIVIGAVLMFAAAVFLVRTQLTVTDVDYMEGMIPHHSIAILTSENAQIDDPRVRELADGIIEAQLREIQEMEWLIRDIRAHGIVETASQAEARPVPDFSGVQD